MEEGEVNAILRQRRAKRKCKICLILINPLPLHRSPQFPISNGKFTLVLCVTGRSKLLWSLWREIKNQFILYGNYYNFFKEHSDFSPVFKAKM